MDFKKALLPLFLIMVMASANAYMTATINEPTDGQTYFLNLVEADRCADVNVTIVDTNADASLHYATIQYDYKVADANSFILNDTNLDTSICHFHAANVWTTPGVDCRLIYCWSTANPNPGSYTLDVNIVGYVPGKVEHSNDVNAYRAFTINTAYVSPSVISLVNVIPIVLVAAIIIVATLGLMGVVSPRTVIVLLPGLVITLIALLIIGSFTQILAGTI